MTIIRIEDVENLIPSSYHPHLKWSYPTLNPVQSACAFLADKDCNLLVAAETSAGKTQIAESFMANTIWARKRALFVSPYKAISQEKYDSWSKGKQTFGPYVSKNHLNLSIVTGDYILTDKRVEELMKSHLVILTSEMLNSRVRRYEKEKNLWLKDSGIVVFDEIHLIDTDRGDKIEAALMLYSKLNPDSRIVCLSATLPNCEEIAEWISKLNGKPTYFIESTYRPVELNIQKFVGTSDVVGDVVEEFERNPDDKTIIFVHTKKNGREVKNRLQTLGYETDFHCSDAARSIAAIGKCCARARLSGCGMALRLRQYKTACRTRRAFARGRNGFGCDQ